MHKYFSQKTLKRAFFPLAPAANHAWHKPIFYWWHEMAACCYFGVDLRNGPDHNSLSRFNGRDSLLLFLLALLSSSSLLGQNNSKPKTLSLSFLNKLILSPTSILQKYSKTIPNSVLAAKPFQFSKNILSPTFFVT